MLNVTSAAPAGMITDCGTVASVVSLLNKLTVRLEVVGVLRLTLPTAAFDPAASLNVFVVTLSVKVAFTGGVGVGVTIGVGTGVGVATGVGVG